MPRRKQSIANKIKAREPLGTKEAKSLLGIHYRHIDRYEQVLAMQIGRERERTEAEITLKEELQYEIDEAIIESEPDVKAHR